MESASRVLPVTVIPLTVLSSPQWWQVEKVNPIKLYEENKVMAGFSLLNLLFKQGGGGQVRNAVHKLFSLYNEKKIKPRVDSLWALEEVIFFLLATSN